MLFCVLLHFLNFEFSCINIVTIFILIGVLMTWHHTYISAVISPQLLNIYYDSSFFLLKKVLHPFLYKWFFLFQFTLLERDPWSKLLSFCYLLSSHFGRGGAYRLICVSRATPTWYFDLSIYLNRKAVVILFTEALCQGGWIFSSISFHNCISKYRNISVSSVGKNLPAMQETQVQFLGREDPLEKEMATHSSILAWRIPWTEEPGGLQSMGRRSQTWLSD